MLDADAVRQILDILNDKPAGVTVEGKEYFVARGSSGEGVITLPPPDTYPSAVQVGTLTGLLDHLRVEGHHEDGAYIHVVGPSQVDVISTLGNDRHHTRVTYARAIAGMQIGSFFGTYQPVEQLLITLQTLFQKTDDRETLLRLLSGVKQEAVKTSEDNGLSQVVTTKSGITLVAQEKVPSPVYLSPYRTFHEIPQPMSPFVVRASGGNPQTMPTFAFFLADGGAWVPPTMLAIKAWLEANLGDELKGVTVVA